MELKLWRLTISVVRLTFKSHLYGIEIRLKTMFLAMRLSLNRTFMELKFGIDCRQSTLLDV